jgi:hypothetical protein
VFRATGVLSLLAIGAIHFLQIVPTTEATPLLGLAFLVLIVASLVLAARLAISGDAVSWMATALVSAGAIGGYMFTRTFNTPLDNVDVGNWSCMLGLGALFVETTLLASSVYAAMTARALQPAVAPASGRSAGLRPERSNAA